MMKHFRIVINIVKTKVKQQKNALLVSVCNVIILTMLTYFLNNQPLFTGENLFLYSWLEWIKSELGVVHEDFHDVVFINTAYDKKIIRLKDRHNNRDIGLIDITDRSKLLSFLQIIDSINSNGSTVYKYIFVDIEFQRGYKDPIVDSLLFTKIHNMKNIVVFNSTDFELADTLLLKKSAVNEYTATIIATNFVRYKYLYDGMPSMALYAYQELEKKSINKHLWGFFYTCDGSPCYNSLFVNCPRTDKNNPQYSENGDFIYYNLCKDVLEPRNKEDILSLIKDRYIVIGDMEDDVHDTYSNKKTGSMITYYAFQELMKNNHLVSYPIQIFMSVLYFLISMFQFRHQSLLKQLLCEWNVHSKPLYFAITFVEYTSLLYVVAIFLNIMYGVSITIFIPSLYFTVQKNVLNYKRSKI